MNYCFLLVFSLAVGCRIDGKIMTKWAPQLLLDGLHGSWVAQLGNHAKLGTDQTQ